MTIPLALVKKEDPQLLALLGEVMALDYPAWDDPEFAKIMSWRLGVIDTLNYLLGITAQLRMK